MVGQRHQCMGHRRLVLECDRGRIHIHVQHVHHHDCTAHCQSAHPRVQPADEPGHLRVVGMRVRDAYARSARRFVCRLAYVVSIFDSLLIACSSESILF